MLRFVNTIAASSSLLLLLLQSARATSAIADLGAMAAGPGPELSEANTVGMAARLMKNREDIDVQSNYHEYEIRETGNVQDELAARLVRNRGPITAKITASGTTRRAASGEDAVRSFSLVAWKFAGDDGLVRGIMEEQIVDDDGDDEDEDRVDGEGGVDRRRRRRGLTVDVDCMARDGRVAVVGGTVRGGGGGSPSPGGGPTPRRRAYVRVGDGGDGGGDYISGVLLDVDLDLDLDGGGVAAGAGGGRCRAPAVADALAGMEGSGSGDVVVGSLVSVCSKRDGDWDRCLLKKARIEEAIDRVDRAIE